MAWQLIHVSFLFSLRCGLVRAYCLKCLITLCRTVWLSQIFAPTLIECFFDRSFLAEMRDTTLVWCEMITMCFFLPSCVCVCVSVCLTAKLIDTGPSSQMWQDAAPTLREREGTVDYCSVCACNNGAITCIWNQSRDEIFHCRLQSLGDRAEIKVYPWARVS